MRITAIVLLVALFAATAWAVEVEQEVAPEMTRVLDKTMHEWQHVLEVKKAIKEGRLKPSQKLKDALRRAGGLAIRMKQDMDAVYSYTPTGIHEKAVANAKKLEKALSEEHHLADQVKQNHDMLTSMQAQQAIQALQTQQVPLAPIHPVVVAAPYGVSPLTAHAVAANAAISVSEINADAARRAADNARLAAQRAQDQAELNSERLRDQQALDAARARDVQAITAAATKVQVAAVKTEAAVARQRETIAAMTAAQNAAQQARVFEAQRQAEAEQRHAQEQLQLERMDEHRREEKLAAAAAQLRVEHERLVAAEHARAEEDKRERRQNQWQLRESVRQHSLNAYKNLQQQLENAQRARLVADVRFRTLAEQREHELQMERERLEAQQRARDLVAARAAQHRYFGPGRRFGFYPHMHRRFHPYPYRHFRRMPHYAAADVVVADV